MTVCAVVPTAEKVAWPALFVVPEIVVSVLPAVGERASVTALPEMGFPAPSRIVTVRVEAVTPSAGTEAGEASTCERSLLMPCTTRVLLVEALRLALLELTLQLVSPRLPALVAVTRVEIWQLPFAGMVAPVRDHELPPAAAVRVPPQVLLVTAGEVLRPPVKWVSEQEAPVMAVLLGFVIVRVLVLVALTTTVEGLKVRDSVGADNWAAAGTAQRPRTANPADSSARRPPPGPGKNLTPTPRITIVVYYLQA